MCGLAQHTQAPELRGCKRLPYTGQVNAVTLGNHCYFPVRLLEVPVPFSHPDHVKIAWLIHELTHVWQYQKMGWRYLGSALKAQLSQGAQAYDFGGEAGLLEARQQGAQAGRFQPGAAGGYRPLIITNRLCAGADVSAWQPFIAELQQVANP